MTLDLIIRGTLLVSIFIVVLARVFIPVLVLSRNDIHSDELCTPFGRVAVQMFIVYYATTEGA